MGFGMINSYGKTGYYAKQAFETATNAKETADEALELAEEAIERVEARVIKVLPAQDGTLTYDGTEQTVTWKNVTPGSLTFGGVQSATNAGSYTATCKPTKSYKWEDGTVGEKNIVWTIDRQAIYDVPSQTGAIVYDGTEKSPTWENYDTDKMTIGGTTTGTDVGSYNAAFTPKANYKWQDGSVDAKTVAWSIVQELLIVPAQSGTLTFDGTEKTPVLDSNYDPSLMTLSGDTAATNAGTYTLTVSLTDAENYRWEDGTATPKTVSWTIGRSVIGTVPSQDGTLTYTGNAQTVSWANYNPIQLTLDGTTVGTDAGTYTAVFTPKSNYTWSDGIDAKNVTWEIGKAAGGVTLSKDSITLNTSTLTDTFTYTRLGDGAVTVTSSDSTKATVSDSSGTVTVTAVASGSATVTVSAAEGTNYFAASSTVSVAVQLRITKALNECTPAEIQQVVNGGYAEDVWDIGDKTAAITLSGEVSDGLTLSNYTCHAVLIGLDHNKENETGGKSSAHFILGQDTSGKDIAFCDFTATNYTYKTSGTWFNHSNANSTSGGWKSSNIRTNIMPKFIAALPAAWQNVLGTVTKYTDNTGDGSDTASYVTATSDKMFLLAEFEAFGKRYAANSAEKNKQTQYAYYANGNSRVRYNHQTPSSAVRWWLRSGNSSDSYYFCRVNTDGTYSGNLANNILGVAPGFAIVKNN